MPLVGVYDRPRSDYFPGSGQFPSDTWRTRAVGGIASGEAMGTAVVDDSTPRIYGVGIASAEAFGAPAQVSVPGLAQYPSSSRFPDRFVQGSQLYLLLWQMDGGGVASGEAFDSGWLFETTKPLDIAGPVGMPRVGLRPGRGRLPGHLLPVTVEEPQHPYRRIHFPSSTVFPGLDLYPDRYDLTPVARHGWSIITGRETIRVRRNGTFHTFKAVFDKAVGHLNAHGVFSSDLSGRIPYTVEFSGSIETSELAGGVDAVELATGSAPVELEATSVELDFEDSPLIGVEVVS